MIFSNLVFFFIESIHLSPDFLHLNRDSREFVLQVGWEKQINLFLVDLGSIWTFLGCAFLQNFLPLIAPEVDQFSSSTLYWLFYIRSTLGRGQVRLHIDWVNAKGDIPCRPSQRWVFIELKSLLKFVGKVENFFTIPHWLGWRGLSPCGLFQRRVRLYIDWVNTEWSECRISRRTQKYIDQS
jgi:hypothetical protein